MKRYTCFALYFGLLAVLPVLGGEELSEKRFRNNLQILSSDDYEGRKPSTPGGRMTVSYIEKQFRQAGVFPGNKGSYLQAVHLASLATQAAKVSVSTKSHSYSLTHGDEILAFAREISPQLTLSDSEVVFVGYGVVSPEHHWDDYQHVDVKGKTVIMLSNDPGYLAEDASLFLGKGVTYYATDTYKYEEAERQGAAAAFIIHDSRLSKMTWAQHKAKHDRERQVLHSSGQAPGSVIVQGYISSAFAKTLLNDADLDYMQETKGAGSHNFKARSLATTITMSVASTVKSISSNNVIGIIPGTERPDEYVIYVAHWDHLGRDDSLVGDQIFNGARDNAAGIASLIELAHLHQSGERKGRSIVLMAVTAEESGMLGSYYYVKNPVYPLRKTVGVINLDMMNLNGKTRDVLVHGIENSALMDAAIIEAVESKQGRIAKPFGRLEAGIAYRNDGFSFNRSGIPTIGLASGSEHITRGSAWMDAQAEDYFEHRYHQLADEYDEGMDVSGALLDVMSLYLIGAELAESKEFAQWYEGKEFKYLRDAQLNSPPRK